MSRRLRSFGVAALLAVALPVCPSDGHAGWGADGVLVSPEAGGQAAPTVVPDGAGGWYVGWTDYDSRDLYLQRLDENGNVAAEWPEGGITICSAPNDQALYALISDGAGGVICVWSDNRNGLVTGYDIYVHRILSNGQPAPEWPLNGLPLCTAPAQQRFLYPTLDGTGGLVVAWDHHAIPGEQSDIYASRVLLDGTIDPAWPHNGRLIADGPGWQSVAGVVPDGVGGTIVVWSGHPAGGNASYAIRLNPDGTAATGWQPNGNLIAAPGLAVRAVADGEGGLYAAMLDARSTPAGQYPDFYFDIYTQRVRGDGTIAPGWPADGKPVAVADGYQHPVVIAPDQQGGLYLGWRDSRNYSEAATDIYVQRMMPNGEPVLGWPVNGLRACSFLSFQEDPSIVVDALGRVVVGFTSLLDNRVYVQHLTPAGTLVNEAEPSGRSVTTAPTHRQERIRLGADQFGNVVAAFEDNRILNNSDIYAQRVVTGPPTATTVSLVSAQADPGRVLLGWHAVGDLLPAATVYRREEASDWTTLGAPRIERDRISFEDVSVMPGARYAYRLGYRTPDGEAFTTETWVTVPAAHRFALAGARPNPVRNDLTVTFSLASNATAQLELFDLTGRRVAATSFAAPSPGTHHVRLADARRLNPGVYWMRLQQGAEVARSRVVVVR